MNISRSSLWTMGLVAALSFSTVPVRAADQALIDAATQEGEVVWYSAFPLNGPVRYVVEAFQAKYPGITVNVAAMSPNDTVTKITDEAKVGNVMADVSNGTSNIGPLKREGLVECHIPESASIYPESYVDPDGCWTAVALYFYGTAINTDLVSEDDAPNSLEDLLDPKWKGKLAMAASQGPAGGPGFVGTVLETLGEEEGLAFLEKLAAQDVVLLPSNPRASLDQVIAGQFPILLSSINQHSYVSGLDGAPVRWLPNVLTWGGLDTAFVIKDSPHPNAAKLFVDFMVSDEGQEAFKAAGSVPASPNVSAADDFMKPETGGYTARVYSIEEADTKIEHWRDVFANVFR